MGQHRTTQRHRGKVVDLKEDQLHHRLHQMWAMDFQFDATTDGRRLKLLNVIDEHSRLCLAIRVGRRCKAKDLLALLKKLTSPYPAPSPIRSDIGPAFLVQALRNWCEANTTSTTYIKPEASWENGFAESYELRSTALTTADSGMSSSTRR